MRAPQRAFVALLCSTVGCFGGPTSDWPTKNSDEDRGPGTPASGADGDDDGAEAPSKGGEPATDDGRPAAPGGENIPPAVSKDAGATKATRDAGVVHPGDAAAPTGDAAADSVDAGADSGDAGADSVDAGAPTVDAGARDGGSPDGGNAQMCTLDTDRRGLGACYGVYCDMTPGELVAKSQPAGACTSAIELTLACDGEIARVVSQCAESNALMLGSGRAVARCAARSDSLSEVRPACVDCYVDEVLCAATSCLAACLSSDRVACADCRLSRCGAQFRSCSGLPKQ